MGGKHKQAQRIKNNARPSSSGRSAELLASSSQSSHFSSLKEIRFVPPTLSLMKTEEFDNSVAPAFQLVLKKMNKKDCTTKIKALQEFSDLIESSEAEAIKTILSFWATLYSILATDTDHRVREAAHVAHLQIVLKDKKIIAPFLKQFIGPWFTSQYDNYAPAASAATKAFNAAFPPNKIQDCVVFCQKEILKYIFDNLTTKLENVGKTGNNDEAEAKFERIVISSLQGYCLFLKTLSSEQIEKTIELNEQIIENQKFLKLATHKAGVIRGAWFSVVATLYHKAPFLLQCDHGHLVPAIMSNLDENEPNVVGSVWEAALLVMESIEEWWKHINVERLYVSKLKKVLREGGQGNASVIYPNLISLLNKLPPSLRTDQFYDNFFESVRFGLKKRTVLSSRSESTAVVTALVECLQYIILQNHANTPLCEKLIKSHLMPLMEWSLNNDQACHRTVFHNITLLIQYWNRNQNIENYPKFLNLFWLSLNVLFESNFDEDKEDLCHRYITLIQVLKHNVKPKHMKVKFSEEGKTSSDIHSIDNHTDPAYNQNLVNLAYTLLKSYVRQIQENGAKFLLPNVYSLVKFFESHEFLLGLSRNLTETKNENLLGIYEKLLLHWLKSPERCSEVVVDLAFVLLKYLTSEEKKKILVSFLELTDRDTFSWCLKNAFSHPYSQDVDIQIWLKNKKIGDFLIDITGTNLTLECPPELKNLFKLAFIENSDGDLLIDYDTLMTVIDKLKEPLLHPENFNFAIDDCAHLASFVTDMIYTEKSLLKYGDGLLLALFQFSCNDHSDLEFLTEDTQFEINTSWQDVVTTFSTNLPKDELVNLIGKFAQSVEDVFLDKAPVDKIIEASVNLIRAVFIGQPFMVTQVYKLLFDRSFVPSCRENIENLCLSAEYLYGGLTNPTDDIKCDVISFSESDINKYFIWSFIKSSVLNTTLKDEDDEDDEDKEEAVKKKIILAVDNLTVEVAKILFDLTLQKSFIDNFKMTNPYQNVLQYYRLSVAIVQRLPIPNEISEILADYANQNSFLWCKSIYLYHKEVESDESINTYKKYLKLLTNDLSKVHLTQIFGECINYDYIDFTSSILDRIVTLRSLAHCDEIEVQIAEVFEKIKRQRNDNIPRYLFDNREMPHQDAEIVIEVIRLFSKLIKTKFDTLNRSHWDFAVISLSSWASNSQKLRSNYTNLQTQAFMVAVSELYSSIQDKMTELKNGDVKNMFVEEWEELFLPDIHTALLQLWLYLAEQFASDKELSVENYSFMQNFGKVTDKFLHKLIFNRENNLPSWNKILKRCCGLLLNSSGVLQLWGYKMLLIVVPGLTVIDLQSDSSSTPNTKGFTVEQFKEVLQDTHNIVDGVLSGFKLGEDSCQISPFTDSYTYTFAYLLLWNVFLNMCEKSPPELRYQYADWFRNDNYFKCLLNNLFKLIPTEILQYSEGKAKSFFKLFLKDPELNFNEPLTSESLEHLACWIYFSCLSQLPALVRQWWSEKETKVTQVVEKITAFYVTPQLCNQELQDVAHRENNFKNMTIKIIPSVREVIAIYTVDEAQMELVITLPQNYPLGGPDVRCSKQIGGPLHKQWLMQLKKYLLHQNGRIWDGLALWNSSLDKKFDGVEECYICFAVLHPGTYQLPKLSCQTCRKKFHSACLYKWFSTSNKSSCPICRNLF